MWAGLLGIKVRGGPGASRPVAFRESHSGAQRSLRVPPSSRLSAELLPVPPWGARTPGAPVLGITAVMTATAEMLCSAGFPLPLQGGHSCLPPPQYRKDT